MSLVEIQKEALALTDDERAQLALSLLETLPSDEEVLRRDAALESGEVEEISHEEFVRHVQRARQ